MIPRTFGPYEIEELLGRGGMGDVYRARDTLRGRLVALKLLPEALGDDAQYIARFRREQHVAARLREPHVIPIHDFGEIDGRLYIDMRLVDGRNICDLLGEEGTLPPARAVNLIGQVAEALAAAHADGLVHRDVKPSNVLVTPRDFVYVVDFGIARSIGMTRTSLTVTGATIGTLDYMAPERFTNRPVDGRADVYSLACLLHECLTGRRPFEGEDLASIMHAHLYEPPPRASTMTAGVPPRLDEVVARGMAKRPEDRFPTALDLAAAARDALQSTEPVLRSAPAVRAATRRIDRPEASQQTTAVPPTTAASPLRTDGRGPAPGDGAHRPVDRLRPPEEPTRAIDGPPGSTSREPVGLPPGRPPLLAARRARPPGRRLAWLAAVTALLLGGLAATYLLRDLGADADGPAAGQTSASAPTSAAAPPAPSIPIPVAGQSVDVGATPGYIQVAPNGRYAYIASRDAGVVTVLDTTLDSVTATIPIEAGPPRFITFSPDGRTAYVTVYNEERTVNAVAFLDTTTLEVSRTVPVGTRPFAPATTPDGSRLYVPIHDEGRVEVLDTATGEMVDRVPTPPNPHWVVFGNDGRYFYTADHESGVVTAFDTATHELVATIPTGKAPHSLALSPDGSRLAVVNYESNTLSMIDTATNGVVTTIDVGLRPQDVTWAPDGRHLYTANVDEGTIDVISAASGRRTARIPTGNSPTSISVLPDGQRAYVTNLDDGTVRVLDISAT